MAKARTGHCDRSLALFAKKHPSFAIINIGVGLDTRLCRFKHLKNITAVYELDLPVMLSLRDEKLKDVDNGHIPMHRISIDLREDVLKE